MQTCLHARGDHRGESSTREAPCDAAPETGARDQSCGSPHGTVCKRPGRGSYAGGVAEQNYAGPGRRPRKRDEAHNDKLDGSRENNPDPNVSWEESDKQNHKAGHGAMKNNDAHVAKRASNGVEDKKREASPKPINPSGPLRPAFRTRAGGALGTTGHTRSQYQNQAHQERQ